MDSVGVFLRDLLYKDRLLLGDQIAARLRSLHRHRLLGCRDAELQPEGSVRLSGGSSLATRGNATVAQRDR